MARCRAQTMSQCRSGTIVLVNENTGLTRIARLVRSAIPTRGQKH